MTTGRHLSNRQKIAALLATLALVSSGCSISKWTEWITRTETDTFTITDRDSTYNEVVRNVPGTTRDTSHVQKSSRIVEIYTRTSSFDSIAKRDYPNFLRLGL